MIETALADLLARAPEPNSLPLWGVPFAVKDNIDVTGLPTTCACPAFARQPQRSAGVVERLIAAGAIVVGKTNTPELGLGSHTYNTVHGTTRNAWDPSRSAGGSSGGAAVAVAKHTPTPCSCNMPSTRSSQPNS